ncbi:hypothetical protein EUGRSUZ_C01991 [Eucalyptus grandis]|uniref:Uncharacterized protein n=2 Tax=Eucalyptus grandis TaxID=71139 RepID=A0ACC3LEL0_EUCGR|nr:hypothetical protein EUGRSUZ_C01991 [Eucalyptus grandis]
MYDLRWFFARCMRHNRLLSNTYPLAGVSFPEIVPSSCSHRASMIVHAFLNRLTLLFFRGDIVPENVLLACHLFFLFLD